MALSTDYFTQWMITHGMEGLKALAIKATPHKEFPHIYSLKYNQIDSPMDNPVVQTCRGLIWDDKAKVVLARAFDKFFNHGEGHAATIDWSTARVQEKLDGSLMILYWNPYKVRPNIRYMGDWDVASSGTPDASGTLISNGETTFAQKFWGLLNKWNPQWRNDFNRDETYIFEMCTLDNRIVIAHPNERVVLIGNRIRDIHGEWNEFNVQELFGNLWHCAQEFPLQSLEDIEQTFKVMDPMLQEGYVIVDGNFNRVKVKHPGYVAIHHVITNLTDKAILEVVRAGEISEVINQFPEYAGKFQKTKTALELLQNKILTRWEETKGIQDRKEFALQVKDEPWSGILFSLKNGKISSVGEGLATMNIERLGEWL